MLQAFKQGSGCHCPAQLAWSVRPRRRHLDHAEAAVRLRLRHKVCEDRQAVELLVAGRPVPNPVPYLRVSFFQRVPSCTVQASATQGSPVTRHRERVAHAATTIGNKAIA